MSNQALLSEIQLLRRDLADLSVRVLALEEQAASRVVDRTAPSSPLVVNYTGGLGASSPVPYLPEGASSAAETQLWQSVVSTSEQPIPVTEADRLQLAREAGAFLRRCLEGDHRGTSGRSRLRLSSRVYILCRDREGRLYNPVSIHRSFSSICPLVKSGSCCGDSIFVGLPSVWEAKVAREAAGLLWPADGEVEEEPAELVPRPIQLRQCTVLVGERLQPDSDYPVGSYEFFAEGDGCPENLTIAIIAVVEIEGRVVVAVPHQVWHRTVSKRKLPPTSLVKPVCVAVDFVDRGEEEEERELRTEKLWLGYFAAPHEAQVFFDPSGEKAAEADIGFVTGAHSLLPSAEALAAAVEQHFAFTSAQSGPELISAPTPGGVDSRLQAFQASLAHISLSLQQLTGGGGGKALKAKPKAEASPACPPGLAAPSAAPVAQPVQPGQVSAKLDADVIASARLAGIPEYQLEEMAKLVVRGRPNMTDLPVTRPAVPRQRLVGERGGRGRGRRVWRAGRPSIWRSSGSGPGQVDQDHEAPGPAEETKQFEWEALLDASGSAGAEGSMSSSRRHAAALRLLKKSLKTNPQIHLHYGGAEHGSRLPERLPNARQFRGPGVSPSVARVEEQSPSLSNPGAPPLGHRRHFGLLAWRCPRGGPGESSTTPLSRRSTIDRPQLLGSVRRVSPGGSSSHGGIQQSHLADRSRASALKADRCSLDGAGIASPERDRPAHGEEAQVVKETSRSQRRPERERQREERRWEKCLPDGGGVQQLSQLPADALGATCLSSPLSLTSTLKADRLHSALETAGFEDSCMVRPSPLRLTGTTSRLSRCRSLSPTPFLPSSTRLRSQSLLRSPSSLRRPLFGTPPTFLPSSTCLKSQSPLTRSMSRNCTTSGTPPSLLSSSTCMPPLSSEAEPWLDGHAESGTPSTFLPSSSQPLQGSSFEKTSSPAAKSRECKERMAPSTRQVNTADAAPCPHVESEGGKVPGAAASTVEVELFGAPRHGGC